MLITVIHRPEKSQKECSLRKSPFADLTNFLIQQHLWVLPTVYSESKIYQFSG